MKIIYIFLTILFAIACKTHKPMTGLEQAFFQQLKASISVIYIKKIPIYRIYSTDILFLTDLEKHLFTYQQKKIDINDVLKHQTLSFLENCIGKPSHRGDGFIEYYLLESCLADKSEKCNKLVVKFDKINQSITDFNLLSIDYLQFVE